MARSTNRRKSGYKIAKKAKLSNQRRLPASIRAGSSTTRPFHKKLMLHPITVFFLICAGVLMLGLTIKSSALSYNVNGKVPAAPLTQPAVITTPENGAVYTKSTFVLQGACPANSYVKLYINGSFGGVAWCKSGHFKITASLFVGRNDLRVQDYNITDDAGPVSPTITVTYRPISSNSSGNGNNSITSSGGSGSATLPLLLITDFHYRTFLVGKPLDWTLEINGGMPPFVVNIDWGDGDTSQQNYESDQKFTIDHVYQNSGYYDIMVSVTDKSGDERTVQLATLIKDNGAAGATRPTSPSGPNQSFWGKWLWMAWPVYGAVGLMAFSFWLGEREIFFHSRNKNKNNRFAH